MALWPGREPLPLNMNTPFPALVVLLLCVSVTLTHSRSSVENQRLFVLCDWLVSLNTMSLLSNRFRAHTALLGIVALACVDTWRGPFHCQWPCELLPCVGF